MPTPSAWVALAQPHPRRTAAMATNQHPTAMPITGGPDAGCFGVTCLDFAHSATGFDHVEQSTGMNRAEPPAATPGGITVDGLTKYIRDCAAPEVPFEHAGCVDVRLLARLNGQRRWVTRDCGVA